MVSRAVEPDVGLRKKGSGCKKAGEESSPAQVSDATNLDEAAFLRIRKNPESVAHWLFLVLDAMMAEYGLSPEKAIGGVVRTKRGKRRRVFGMSMAVITRLWPVMLARYGVEKDGPTSGQEAYINAASAKRDELEAEYVIIE